MSDNEMPHVTPQPSSGSGKIPGAGDAVASGVGKVTGSDALGKMAQAATGEGMTGTERAQAATGAAANMAAGAAVTAATGSAAAGKVAGKAAEKVAGSKMGTAAIIAAITLPILIPVLVMAVVVSVVFGMVNDNNSDDDDTSNATITSGILTGVPEEYKEFVLRAGSICPEVTPGIIAAQLQAESGFDPNATSRVGAAGIAQFMPSTWAGAGKDGDGDGIADIRNPADAIWSQGNYMCAKVQEVRSIKGSSSSVIELALAAYNAGFGNVQEYNGIPPFKETRDYVTKIMDSASDYWSEGSFVSGGGSGKAVEAMNFAVKTWVGKTYVYGGYDLYNSTDCSGLVKSSFATVGITLPRTAGQQLAATQRISASEAKPGDTVYWTDSSGYTYHTAIYMGNGQIVEAASPTSGIRIGKIWTSSGTTITYGRVTGAGN